eukprot:1903451-Rhodomonas_salina.2
MTCRGSARGEGACYSRNQLDLVGLVELRRDVSSKQVPSAARAQAPAVNVLGVRPHEVAHGPVVRDLLLAVYRADLVERVDGGRESAVDAEDLAFDQRREREVVEHFCAVSPHVHRAILAQALVIEPIHLRDLPALVVSADQRDAVRVPHLEGQQQKECLYAVKAAVNEISHEQIVCVRAIASDIEQFLQIKELSVDVAAYCDRCIYVLHVAFLHQNLTRLRAQTFHLRLLDVLAALELLNLAIQI